MEQKFFFQTTEVSWNYSQILRALLDNQAEKPWKDKPFLQDTGVIKPLTTSSKQGKTVFLKNIFRDYKGAFEIKIIRAIQNSEEGLEEKLEKSQKGKQKDKEMGKEKTFKEIRDQNRGPAVYRRKTPTQCPSQWMRQDPHHGAATTTSANSRNIYKSLKTHPEENTGHIQRNGSGHITCHNEAGSQLSSAQKMISNPGFYTQPNYQLNESKIFQHYTRSQKQLFLVKLWWTHSTKIERKL